MNPIILITIFALMLQSAMLVLFYSLPDPLGLSLTEMFSGKTLWQISMAFGAILIISSPFAFWQKSRVKAGKSETLPARFLVILFILYFTVAIVDYEVFRFSHQRLSYSFLRTYFHISNITDSTTISTLDGDFKGTILWLAMLFINIVGGIALAVFCPFRKKLMFVKTSKISTKTPIFLVTFGVILSIIPLILFLSGTRGIKIIPILNAPVDMRFTLGKHTLTAPVLHIAAVETFEFIRDNHKITEDLVNDLDTFLPPGFAQGRPNSKEYPAFRSAPLQEYKAKIPYNIILVFGESYKGRIFNQMLSGDTTLAPNLWKLASDSIFMEGGGGLWFKNAFSGGYPTVRGTTATYLGFPSHPNRDVPSFYASNHFTGFPEFLTNYAKAYMTVSNPVFDHTLPFVEKFFGDNWRVAESSKGEGTGDSLGMDLTISMLNDLPTDKPYFLVYNTISTHIPFFGYPNDFAPKPDNSTERYRNAVGYIDNQFGRLLNSLKERPDFNRTVIIVVGDHDTPVDSTDYTYPQPIGVSAAQIFLGIFSPDTNLFKGLEVREDVASQLDIAPTVLDLAQVKVENHFWGYDLLTQKRPAEQPALFFSENGYLLGFRDSVLIGGLSSPEMFKGKILPLPSTPYSFEPVSDSLSLVWKERAIGASKVLKSLLRNDKMQP